MKYKTFNEWSLSGYKIIRGSKAIWFDGVAKFSEKQVVKRCTYTTKKRRSYTWYDESYDEPYEISSDAWDFMYGD